MNIIYDFQKLGKLLASFSTITSLRYSLVSTESQVLCASIDRCEFCELINSTPEGHARCVASDACASSIAAKNKGIHVMRCHAGAIDIVLPIMEDGEIIAFLFFGQIINSSDQTEQWEKAKSQLSWHSNVEALKEPFFKMQQLSDDYIDSCSEILQACSSYIWFKGVIKSALMSELQILNNYVDENYASSLTLTSISEALSMSKTKLCSIAAKQSTTLTKLINQRRISAAKDYLRTTDLPISTIASLVGVQDYNYFTKIFKSIEKITPREYRKVVQGENKRFGRIKE